MPEESMTLIERLRNPAWEEHSGQSIVLNPTRTEADMREAAGEIERLRDLLRRADNVVTWETTPNGASFQEEIEAALGVLRLGSRPPAMGSWPDPC